MGSDDAIIATEAFPYPYSFKVHRSMCTELMILVDRIDNIFPEIEAARPPCKAGIEVLSLLKNATDGAKQLFQYFSESSKLYMALTGETMLKRCRRTKDVLTKYLGQIQSLVPVPLAAKIYQIIDDLRAATLVLDCSEEDAGKIIHDLLHRAGKSEPDTAENCKIKFQLVASRLHITTPKAILLEKRSIRKMLEKLSDKGSSKEWNLKVLLKLLKKYENVIKGEQSENPSVQHEMAYNDDFTYSRTGQVGYNNESKHSLAQTGKECEAPPEEYRCPISKKLMYDPVTIDSGETFERMWIQKWFNDGNDTCPKTNVKLTHQFLTPNMVMKDLISKWCEKNKITLQDPSVEAFQSLDISSTSINSLTSSMNDMRLPLDVSNISLGSLDSSYSSDLQHVKVTDGSRLKMKQKNDDSQCCHRDVNSNAGDFVLLLKLSELHWDLQCNVIENIISHVQYDGQDSLIMSSGNYIQTIIQFIRDAFDQNDMRAQTAGFQLLLALLRKSRNGISYLSEDAFSLIASYLDSEVTKEVLAVLEVLSDNSYCKSKITASGALGSILKFVGSQSNEIQEHAVKILHNLSSESGICSQIVSMGFIPKLVPLINNIKLARHCIVLLKNLCDTEEARVSVAETNGCLASICKLIESENSEVQEHAVAVLLSLCSQRVEYCHLVMHEGVIPPLSYISVNGSDRGKVSALELLRQLRDMNYDGEQESFDSGLDVAEDHNHHPKEKKLSPKMFGFRNFFSRTVKGKG